MKVRLKTNKKIVVEYFEVAGGPAIGKVDVFMNWRGPIATFEIYTPKLDEVGRQGLADYAAALKKACNLLGDKINKPVSLSGTHVDPDEPKITPGTDSTVIYKIYPRDKKSPILTFTLHDETGRVGAHVGSFTHRDIASAVQVACVAQQAAALMAQYEKVN